MTKAPTALLDRTSATERVDSRIVASIRLILATAALLIVIIDPSEPSRLAGLTYAALYLYIAYSTALYIVAVRHARLQITIAKRAHWLDVAWYALLVALSEGTSSIFFFGFFFAILVASFRWGFASGMRVTVASVFLFFVVGYVARPEGDTFELNRTLIRPVYMLALGYMMSYWGGFEIAYKSRLALLKEVSALSNPRFGVDRTIGSLLEQLRNFYKADACLLIRDDTTMETPSLKRVSQNNAEAGATTSLVPAELANMLLSLPGGCAVVYNSKQRIQDWWRMGTNYRAYDVIRGSSTPMGQDESKVIAATLDASAFVSVPVLERTEDSGRLYLTSGSHGFDDTDADFLLQVMRNVTPVLDNIRLVDRLAWDAAEEERQKIARDLHDSVIQPYIGLRIGLEALREKVRSSTSEGLGQSIDQLIELTNDGIADLRGYVSGLKSGSDTESDLLAALRRFVKRFAAATHIDVEIESTGQMHINGRLAAEVFQMVAEGLSNVRRHTPAGQAAVRLTQHDGHLVLRLENERAPGEESVSFIPRSLSERAVALGGHAQVEQLDGRITSVVIDIPL